jgi:hypothetical protein
LIGGVKLTEFLNVPSYNVGQGPVTFGNFTSAPGTPPTALGATRQPALGATPTELVSTLSSNQKMVLGLGLVASIGASVTAFKVPSKRRSMSAVAFSAFPLALIYAGLN